LLGRLRHRFDSGGLFLQELSAGAQRGQRGRRRRHRPAGLFRTASCLLDFGRIRRLGDLLGLWHALQRAHRLVELFHELAAQRLGRR